MTKKNVKALLSGRLLAAALVLMLTVCCAAPVAGAEAAPETEPAIVEEFADLYEINNHLIGWMSAGQRIDYPIVQYDDDYYLHHDYYGNESKDGTIFINSANRLEPRDNFLLFHGHNMKSGAMFGDLDFFKDYEYVRKYPLVMFRTIWDEEEIFYAPVAIFNASMNKGSKGYFNIGRIRFTFDQVSDDPEVAPRSTDMEAYIADLRAHSLWDSPVEADSTDEYIVLISCSYEHENGRLMMICRRLRDGETPESMTELIRG